LSKVGLKSYFASGVTRDAFVLAVKLDLVVVQFFFARKDGIDNLFAGYVLYLSAREVKAINQLSSLLVVETAEHGLPNELAGLVGGFIKLDLIYKAAVESLVQA
jgi:hypothetical protein